MLVILYFHAKKLQARTILLTLLSSGLLSTKQVAELIGLSNVQTKAIAKNLEREDISSLLDKRQGQKKDYVIDFEKDIEKSIGKLQRDLKLRKYVPTKLKKFIIRDPKTRTILLCIINGCYSTHLKPSYPS